MEALMLLSTGVPGRWAVSERRAVGHTVRLAKGPGLIRSAHEGRATSSLSLAAVRVVARAVHLSAARLRVRVRSVCQPEAGQRHPGETDAEFLQRRAASDGLG